MIGNAVAQTANAAGEVGFLGSILPFLLIFVVIYFLMIRPQSKRQKELKNMLGSLKEGDEVVTVSGLMGKITYLDDASVKLKIAESVEVKMQKQAVSALLPAGSINS